MCSEQEKLTLHFKYCAFIALLLLVAIATERWSASKDFTTYLSNAATMTSLILGIVAIFYSFISNDSMSRSLGSITMVNDEVRKTREEIGAFSALTKQAVEMGEKNTSSVNQASTGLSASMVELGHTLSELSAQNDKLQLLISALPPRIDQLELRVGDVAKSLGEKAPTAAPPIAAKIIPDSAIDALLSRSSVIQNIFLHALALGSRTKKEFSVSDFCQATQLNFENNLNGYLAALVAMRICTRTALNVDRKFKITALHPVINDKAKKYIVDYLENQVAPTESNRDKWKAAIVKVDEMFS